MKFFTNTSLPVVINSFYHESSINNERPERHVSCLARMMTCACHHDYFTMMSAKYFEYLVIGPKKDIELRLGVKIKLLTSATLLIVCVVLRIEG